MRLRLRPPATHHGNTARNRPSRRVPAGLLALGLVAAASGCSTPRTAAGTLQQGKERVVRLVLDAAHALPPTVVYDPPTQVGTQTCRRTIAGYTVGRTGAHRAEVPLIVQTPSDSPRTLLGVLETAWARAGYRIDRSRIHETGFPQLRAHTPDGYEVVATAFVPPRGPPKIDLYAVSQCLRGS